MIQRVEVRVGYNSSKKLSNFVKILNSISCEHREKKNKMSNDWRRIMVLPNFVKILDSISCERREKNKMSNDWIRIMVLAKGLEQHYGSQLEE